MRLKTVILLALACVLTSCAEVAYAQSQSPSNYGNITATGSDCTVTPAACVSLHFPYSNTGVVGIQVTGTWVATLVSQGSSDNGATWFTVNMTPYTASIPISSTAANGNWQAFVGGLTDFRIRASAYTSGTALIVINSTSAVGAGAVEVGSVTSGTASATTQGGVPMMCDSATSGTVTAGQAQMVRCNTAGQLSLVSASTANDGSSNTLGFWPGANGTIILAGYAPFWFNGATWDRQFYCPNKAKLNALAAATTQIVALSGATKIRVCSAVISNNNATATTLKMVEGTGANCATGQTDTTALLNIGATSTAPISLQWGASGAVTTTTGGDALCFTSSAASSLEIEITYAQF